MTTRFVARPSKNFTSAHSSKEMATQFQKMNAADFIELDDRDAIHLLCALDLYPKDSLCRIDAMEFQGRLEYLCRALGRGEQIREFTRDPFTLGDEGLDADSVRVLVERLRRLACSALATGEPILLVVGYSHHKEELH